MSVPPHSLPRIGGSTGMSARTILTVLIMLLLTACGDNAPDGDSRATATEPTTTAESDPLVGRGEVELVDEGYGFTEGPQWMRDEGVLLFTDNDTIYQVAADDEITVFRMPSNYSNGLAVDPEGRLIAAEADARRVTRTESDGTVTTIAERFHGALLNQPNDIVVRSDGTIYFTDPTFGDAAAQAELDFRGIFRIAPDGGLTAERRGMTVDNAGNLFVTTGSGIEVFSPDGARWGVIPVPRIPANCAFGGADGRTLFITAREGLYRVTLANPGPY
jgi:gluconolactonase